jgi:NAD(P)-dependent dehydrogenase (short-subunit alcohol dehydrogenase family)
MPVNFDLKDKVIAITGAASGIGLATAELLAAHGAKVSLADVSADALSAVAARLSAAGHTVMHRAVDVRSEEQLEAWIAATVAAWGPLDGAANLAGVIPRGIGVDTVVAQPADDWRRVLDVNLSGVFHSLRAQLPRMADGGSVVNASSVAGAAGFARNAAYAAAKHGVVGLSRSACKEVGERGVRVNCVAPGVIDTPMQRAAMAVRGGEQTPRRSALERSGTAEEVASLIAWLLCDESRYITGGVHHIDGGWIC